MEIARVMLSRGVGSNFALVGRKVKGVEPGEEEVGGTPFLSPTPLTSTPGNGGPQQYNIIIFYNRYRNNGAQVLM